MENKDAVYWKKQYEVNEMILLKTMVDLDNYREMVDRQKRDIQHLKTMYDFAEKARLKSAKEMHESMIDFILDDYHHTFQS